MFIKLVTRNDKYGNPRWLYLRTGVDGLPIRAWDIGWKGLDVLPEEFRDEAYNAVRIETTVEFYNETKETFCVKE